MAASVLFLIPARARSERLPGKNLRLLGGIPLVGRAVRAALAAARSLDGHGHRVVCSTEDDAIARVASEWGAEVPFVRPPELAADSADVADVAVHALERLEAQGQRFAALALVRPSSPLVLPEDLAAAVRSFLGGPGQPVASVSPALHGGQSFHLIDGCLHVLDTPGGAVVALNGAVVVADPDSLRRTRRLVEPGRTLACVMPVERGARVDTPAALYHCEALLSASNPRVEVAGRAIGSGAPCFVIAEAGVNHNGEAELAHRLVDAAADAGADAVKFQTFDPDLLATADAPRAEYQERATGQGGSQHEMLRQLALPREAHAELAEHARRRGILFLSSPFDAGSADFLHELGVPAFKIPSGELTNHPFLAHLARKGRPLLVSTGMSRMVEVAAAVDAIRAEGDVPLALFHCVSSYPTEPRHANLRAVATLRNAFGVPAGWSDHTPGTDVALAAVALGADLLEKHLTLDRTLPGPDHQASLEPDELERLVLELREVELALGDGEKEPQPTEAAVAAVARKSLHWAADLSAGTLVAEQHLRALRPGTGLPPSRLHGLAGRRLRHAVSGGAQVREGDLEP